MSVVGCRYVYSTDSYYGVAAATDLSVLSRATKKLGPPICLLFGHSLAMTTNRSYLCVLTPFIPPNDLAHQFRYPCRPDWHMYVSVRVRTTWLSPGVRERKKLANFKQVHRFSGLKWCLFLLLHTCVVFLVFGLRNISAHLSSIFIPKGVIVLFTMDRKRMGIYFLDQTHNVGQ